LTDGRPRRQGLHHHRRGPRPRPRALAPFSPTRRQGRRQRPRRIRDRRGADASAAQTVVDEIVAAGGEAVASTDSVSDWDGAQRIVTTAVETFGDLHVLVNNAGILRDRMLVSMSEEEFDAVIAVHLKGTFNMSRFAARLLAGPVEGRPGRSSGPSSTPPPAPALHGNVGQTNYAAAKAGIAAMTIVNAAELKRYGVKVNCTRPGGPHPANAADAGLRRTHGEGRVRSGQHLPSGRRAGRSRLPLQRTGVLRHRWGRRHLRRVVHRGGGPRRGPLDP